jgi:tellurite resistance protein
MSLESLFDKLCLPPTDKKDDFRLLSERLRKHSLFILPDVLAGSAVPGLIDNVVIYIAKPLTQSSQQSPKFRAANMALQLASAVAVSDGKFCDSEHKHLLGRIRDWSHLDTNQTIHLEAHLFYLRITPLKLNAVKLNQIKKRIQFLDRASSRSFAQFIASVVPADGKVLPDEMQMLEKIYKLLELDPSLIYSDLHEDAIFTTSPSSIQVTEPKKSSTDELELDTTKIAQLQKETDQGYELLVSIFSEEDNEDPTADAAGLINEMESSGRTDESLVLGLDCELSMFLCKLMERPSWPRSEVVALASELGLMTDGALESINEASYDRLDLPFAEGDDPVEINPDAVTRLRS